MEGCNRNQVLRDSLLDASQVVVYRWDPNIPVLALPYTHGNFEHHEALYGSFAKSACLESLLETQSSVCNPKVTENLQDCLPCQSEMI